MKNLRGMLFIAIFLITIILANNAKSYAATQYTDNVIPIMTSNTSPSGIASASSYRTSTGPYFAYLAFDHDSSTNSSAWGSDNTTGWLEYNFLELKCITKYTIVSRNPVYSTNELPKSWTFQAYDEQLSKWIVLDTQKNITGWAVGEKKEFTFLNTNLYYKYRINITENNGLSNSVVIGELEMMETVSAPTNLTAKAGISSVQLTWDKVMNAESYIVYRSNIQGGPYDTVVTSGFDNTYNDISVADGVTYYYIVVAIVSGTESTYSNETSATPIPGSNTNYFGDHGVIEITMLTGEVKKYNLAISDILKFITWYDNYFTGLEKAYYIFSKPNATPFLSRREYIIFDKISSFEIMDYYE